MLVIICNKAQHAPWEMTNVTTILAKLNIFHMGSMFPGFGLKRVNSFFISELNIFHNCIMFPCSLSEMVPIWEQSAPVQNWFTKLLVLWL